MAEEETEIVAVDLNSLDLEKVKTVYNKVATIFAEGGIENSPVGWAEMMIIFLGFIDQMSVPKETCPVCFTAELLHHVKGHFGMETSSEEHADGHAVH